MQSEKLPMVSVVVPTHGRADRVGRAVESVLAQDYPNIEVVIVNDNAPGSESWVATMRALDIIAGDPRVTVVETIGSIGGGAARNLGCREAKGELLAFLDDDDSYKPGKISSQVEFMTQNGLEMSFQDVEWVDAKGSVVEYRRLDHVREFSKEGLLRAHMLTPIAPTAIYMLRRDLFFRTEGFGEVSVGQDWYLMLRCIEAGARIGYMEGAFVQQSLGLTERISIGPEKIAGERELYRVRRSFFPRLSLREVQFVVFRHLAVIGVVFWRSGYHCRGLAHCLAALLASPSFAAVSALRFLRKR